MSCDLSDPAIIEAYNEIVSSKPTNWLILGYNDSRDVISLYSKGTGGLSELRSHLSEEVLYGFVRMEDRYILITYVSESVSGVRRARALVHGRAVGALFKAHNAQITASNSTDLSDSHVSKRLKLASESPRSSTSERNPTTPTTSRPQSPISPRPQSPSTKRRQGSVTTAVPSPPQSPSTPSPSEGKGELATSKSTEEAKKLEAERRARAEIEKAEADKKAHEAERLAAIEREEAEKREREAEAERRAVLEKAEADKKAAAEKIEAEKKAKQEAERLQAEKLKRQFQEAEKSGKGSLLSGFITAQSDNTPFWKRRWFTVRSKSLFLYRDQMDKLPIASLDLSSATLDLDDENLMPNSFSLSFNKGKETYVFFSDSQQDYQAIMALLRSTI